MLLAVCHLLARLVFTGIVGAARACAVLLPEMFHTAVPVLCL